MQFKHPELLYALILLIIPIIIHLFQLRKFKKEAFTNLKFLKKVSLQTRKSSKLKKILVLIIRMLAMAALVFAFAQPYFLNSGKFGQEREVVIYLDNSYSMQAKGNKGELLHRSVQELLEWLPANRNFTLFTNNQTYQNIALTTSKKELQNVDFSPRAMDMKSIQLKASNEFSDSRNTEKHFIAISDFQETMGEPKFDSTQFQAHFVKLQPEKISNISIDSAFLESKNTGKYLKIQLSKTESNIENIPIAVYNKEELIAKTNLSFLEKNTASTEILLPENTEFEGKIEIEDNSLSFDNVLYFSITKPETINILTINGAEDDFLRRIFVKPTFNFSSFEAEKIDYGKLATSDFVVLNQVKNIPINLSSTLADLNKEDVGILIIPDTESDIDSYNGFLRNLNFPSLGQKKNQEKLVTNISFSHPIYEGVFDSKVDNFEYPKLQSYYDVNTGGIEILSFEDKRPFLLQHNNIFLFTAPIDQQNSNFQSSPLIVPTLFNIGKSTLQQKKLYYILGVENIIDIPIEVEKDEILEITSPKMSFIPLQQSFSNKVSITTDALPDQPCNFSVLKNNDPIGKLSYNLDRKENILDYSEIKNMKNIKIADGFPEVIGEIFSENNITELWKWFVIFALLFLLIEMLILKFLE